MRCPKCGKRLPKNAKFCSGCGSDIQNPEGFVERWKVASPIRKLIILACIIVIVLILIGAARSLLSLVGNHQNASNESVFDQIAPENLFTPEDDGDTYVSTVSEDSSKPTENRTSSVVIQNASDGHDINVSGHDVSFSFG